MIILQGELSVKMNISFLSAWNLEGTQEMVSYRGAWVA